MFERLDVHLKSLTLKGFKSFADKAVFAVEPGVTCVVGPNGSGKSNISDAVLWVLGEQSAKSLRGQAMEDVIFAGSSARQAVGVAEVDLVLDNSDGTIPLDFNEITITRRMYRSGESEYLINQSPSRLADIRDLLHDSGLGRDAQSIISQGRLTEVLEAKAEERRALIEEAAGVLKHKKRKERALRKLTGLDSKLERANDIANEIDRQLKPLKRQANKALTHAELVAELNELEVSLAVDDLRLLQEKWDKTVSVEKERDGEREILKFKLEDSERELEKLQHLLEEKGLFVGDISEQRRRNQSVLERLEASLLLLEEKGKNLISRLSDLRLQLHNAESRIQNAKSEQENLGQERKETVSELEVLYAQLSDLRKESEQIRKARIALDDQLSNQQRLIRSKQNQLNDTRDNILKINNAISSLSVQAEMLESRKEELAQNHKAELDNLSQRRQRLEVIEESLEKSKREIVLAASDVDKRVRLLDSRKRELEQARENFSQARAEIKGLEEIDRAFVSASPALSKVLEKRESFEGLIGPIADAITPEEDYALLTEKLLGSDLFGLFVRDSISALEVAREVRGSKLGEISIIPVDHSAKPLKKPNVGERLIDFLEYESSVERGVETLLGDIYVVDSLKDAIAASGSFEARFATKDGSVVWPSSKVTVGVQHSDTEGILARKKRLNLLSDSVEGLEALVAEAEARVAEAEEALTLAQQDAYGLSQKQAQVLGERDSLLEELGRVEQTLSRLNQERELQEERAEEIAANRARFEPDLKELEDSVEVLEAELKQEREAFDAIEFDRKLKIEEEASSTSALNECNVKIATVSQREIYLKRQLNAVSAEVENLEDTIAASAQTERSLEILRQRIEPLHETYTALHGRAEHWALMLRDRAKLEQSDSESLRDTISEAREKVKQAQNAFNNSLESLSEIRIEKAQLELKVNTAVKMIVEEIGMPLEHALERPHVEDRVATEDRAFALRKRISNLGVVNPIAKEEFESLQARHEFIKSQIDDLVEARRSLNKVVAAIDRKIRDLFLETFEVVDKNYQEFFSILFPGGTAQLILSEPDNPDETGVEFIAQPRGKKLKKMSLLSGGERSLSAIALLFAVYSVRKVPFFILDEVEQALDDSNLGRFVAFINTMRKHTQFLIITHQRRTMEMADVLYGVSMQADGVSKLVSQKIEQATSK